MNVHDLLQLPLGAATLFAVMVWPALWAAGLLITAFVGDLERMRQKRPR
jgi:hypothetical protein